MDLERPRWIEFADRVPERRQQHRKRAAEISREMSLRPQSVHLRHVPEAEEGLPTGGAAGKIPDALTEWGMF